ncbi:adrenodoxin [Eurytemora carolleeae]|uniref:adrenodoxin n=1 Tax=Eurytemora carolleeae TaxID=1294199 RepID=UPI000C775D2B|nr:adrenodoxin [Eurytemora carolleeae]|eukprot:XP_023346319.1 adrenodoxin-like [Eurytemora affinis]
MFRLLVQRSVRSSRSILGNQVDQRQSHLTKTTRSRSLGLSSVLLEKNLSVTYELGSGERVTVKASEGENLLDVAINNDVDIDGFGACEGTLACSTCHLIFSPEDYKKIEDVVTDEELDMLDLAFGLTDTSRLGCQVCMTKALDGVVAKVPEGVNDQR